MTSKKKRAYVAVLEGLKELGLNCYVAISDWDDSQCGA